jgi:hypothetical protein
MNGFSRRLSRAGYAPLWISRSIVRSPGHGSLLISIRTRLCDWCKYWVAPDPAEMATCFGDDMVLVDWHKRLIYSQRGSRRLTSWCPAASRNASGYPQTRLSR